MAILLLTGRDESEQAALTWFSNDWKEALLSQDTSLDIRIWPDAGKIDEIEFLCVWNHPPGSLTQFPNVKAIYSLAAGVDHLFVDKQLDSRIPIARLIDPYMACDIAQYVTAYVLKHIKRIDHWAAKQKQREWFKYPPFTYANKHIGIMGLGHLGQKTANALSTLGLSVHGYSTSQKDIPGVTCFHGNHQWREFLSKTDILICMLPLTDQTKHILNKDTFAHLRKGAVLINVGRGQHLVEEDLLTALDQGQIAEAYLDVFTQEPLPIDHPFWLHPNITVTPHIASVTNAKTAVKQLYENYLRAKQGQPMLNVVDITKGY